MNFKIVISIMFLLLEYTYAGEVPDFEFNCNAQVSEFNFRVIVDDGAGVVIVINNNGEVFNTISGLEATSDDLDHSHPGYFIYLANEDQQEIAALFINTEENLINGSISDIELGVSAGVNCINTQPVFDRPTGL